MFDDYVLDVQLEIVPVVVCLDTNSLILQVDYYGKHLYLYLVPVLTVYHPLQLVQYWL